MAEDDEHKEEKVAAKMGTPKKRYRRTKAQKALDDAEAEKNSTSAKKAKVTKASQSSSKKKNQGTQSSDPTNNNPQFI
ncbi:hypothetical protein KEM48_003323 [Puccinia striiformis f. sp. tritici PST-130]|nr:hypothetical protein KEM48_003323 [Puccinia striiformis f. sp. tritici PST-130]